MATICPPCQIFGPESGAIDVPPLPPSFWIFKPLIRLAFSWVRMSRTPATARAGASSIEAILPRAIALVLRNA